MTDNLAPCPLCKSDQIDTVAKRGGFAVVCSACGLELWRKHKGEALTVWNAGVAEHPSECI